MYMWRVETGAGFSIFSTLLPQKMIETDLIQID
jgi:hypothetical protein